MKAVHKLLNQRTAQRASEFMQGICYILIAIVFATIVLTCMGRMEYNLSYNGENYPQAIYAEQDHNFGTRSLTISTKDELRVRANLDDGSIELGTYIAIALTHIVGAIPIMLAYRYLAKVFSNVAKGEIFTQSNAQYLLYHGIIQIALAVVYPFAKLLIVEVANMLVSDHIELSTGADIFNNLIPSIAFLVAAYIISYGVNLQDEVDHTL